MQKEMINKEIQKLFKIWEKNRKQFLLRNKNLQV